MTTALALPVEQLTPDVISHKLSFINNFPPEKRAAICQHLVQAVFVSGVGPQLPVIKFKMVQNSIQANVSNGVLYSGDKSNPSHTYGIDQLNQKYHLIFIGAIQAAYLRENWRTAGEYDPKKKNPLVNFTGPLNFNEFVSADPRTWKWHNPLSQDDLNILGNQMDSAGRRGYDREGSFAILVYPKVGSEATEAFIMNVSLTSTAMFHEPVRKSINALMGSEGNAPVRVNPNQSALDMMRLFSGEALGEVAPTTTYATIDTSALRCGDEVILAPCIIPQTGKMKNSAHTAYPVLYETVSEPLEVQQQKAFLRVAAMLHGRTWLERMRGELIRAIGTEAVIAETEAVVEATVSSVPQQAPQQATPVVQPSVAVVQPEPQQVVAPVAIPEPPPLPAQVVVQEPPSVAPVALPTPPELPVPTQLPPEMVYAPAVAQAAPAPPKVELPNIPPSAANLLGDLSASATTDWI
jgi:hypothetical protein